MYCFLKVGKLARCRRYQKCLINLIELSIQNVSLERASEVQQLAGRAALENVIKIQKMSTHSEPTYRN